jgi:hypothetical protein
MNLTAAEPKLILPACNSNAASFFDRQELSDCHVVTDLDGKIRPCHKVVLCSASDCFKAMFVSCDMLEASSSKVAIKDADPAVVDKLLRHMYGLEVGVPMRDVGHRWLNAGQIYVQYQQVHAAHWS